MPKQYEAMRDKFAQTMDYDKAQGKAAAIYNSKHPGAPVTGKTEKTPKTKKTRKVAKPAKTSKSSASERNLMSKMTSGY